MIEFFFFEFFFTERELSVLQEIRDGLSSLMRIHSSSNKIKSYLQSIICKIFVPIAAELGWDKKENEIDTGECFQK